MRKICVVTGTRAEFGLLLPLLEELRQTAGLVLQVVATGMHLSPEFGMTWRDIEAAGFKIDERVEMLLGSDTPDAVAKSMGLAMISFPGVFSRLRPDLLVLLGDRFEAFSVAAAATVCRLPVAHIHGGEVTEGAYDDAFRHAITKMSHLHFTATPEYRQRVIQLGESIERVFLAGALGIENIRKMPLMERDELENELGIALRRHLCLVTYHPSTLEKEAPENQFQRLLDVLSELNDTILVFTKANADSGGRGINEMIDRFVARNSARAVAFVSMGQKRYLSTMKWADVVIGNSSSGIIEAPSLKTATVNIGDRQKGRVRAASVIDCSSDRVLMAKAVDMALSPAFQKVVATVCNPYEQSGCAQMIAQVLRDFPLDGILQKSFVDVPAVLSKGWDNQKGEL